MQFLCLTWFQGSAWEPILRGSASYTGGGASSKVFLARDKEQGTSNVTDVE